MAPTPVPAPWGSTPAPLPAWPPANGLTTINCPRNATVLSVYASTQIYAPANIILNTLRNTTAYPDWNTFVPMVTVTGQPKNSTLPKAKQGISPSLLYPNGKAQVPILTRITGILKLGTNYTDSVVLDPSAPANRTPSFEQVSDLSTPRHESSYVPEDLLKNDGSFYPDLSRLHRISWITDPESDEVKNLGLFTERFNEIIPLDYHGGREKGCEV